MQKQRDHYSLWFGITRDLPPNHYNAIFINDFNKIVQDNCIDTFREAKKTRSIYLLEPS